VGADVSLAVRACRSLYVPVRARHRSAALRLGRPARAARRV